MFKPIQVKQIAVDLLTVVSFFLLSFFFLSVIYAAYINHSAVPFSDTWEGAINFYLDAQSSPAAWWQQHFDHRIVISKLVFWLDLRLFDGQGLIYPPLHILLLIGLFACYIKYAKKLLPALFTERSTRITIMALAGFFAFSWMQRQNIAWEFQSQFILVYLLPLAAFYSLAKTQDVGGLRVKNGWLIGALLLGLASALSMVNGIVVLPLLFFMGCLLKLPKRQLLLIAALAATTIGVFFLGYEKTPGQNFGPALLIKDPLRVLRFALAYLGSPVYLAFKSMPLAITAALLAIATVLFIFMRNKQLKQNPFAIGLFTYLLFVGASAGLTAYGRALFPLEMAAQSRYTTPALSFWMCAFLLVFAHISTTRLPTRELVVSLFLVFVVLIKTQMSALYFSKPANWLPHNKQVTALSLQLNINDRAAKHNLYPISDSRDLFFERAKQAKVSVFSPAVAFPADRFDRPVEPHWDICQVKLIRKNLVDAHRQAYRVTGELDNNLKAYRFVFFADEQKNVIGIALLGHENISDSVPWLPRPDWILHPINFSAFNGYLVGIGKSTAYCL